MSAHRYTRNEVQALLSRCIDTYAIRAPGAPDQPAKAMTMGLMNALLDEIEADLMTWVRCTACQLKNYFQTTAAQPSQCMRCGRSLLKAKVA